MIYFLKDTYQDELISKTNNFSIQTMKYHRLSRIVPFDMQFNKDDIIIYNVNQGNPFSKFKLNNNKKICIVHKINKANIQYINQADFVIYMNPYIEKIAKKLNIDIPSYTLPRHPLYDNNGVSFNREQFVFFGGNFSDVILNNMNNEILSLHKKMNNKLEFLLFPVFGNVPSRRELFNKNIDALRKETKNTRIIVNMSNEIPVDLMLFRSKTAQYNYLWNKGISIEKMNDLINSQSDDILNFDIYESSMLSAMQSGGGNILLDSKSQYVSYFDKANNYYFSDFAKDLQKIIQNL